MPSAGWIKPRAFLSLLDAESTGPGCQQLLLLSVVSRGLLSVPSLTDPLVL